jgi:hypothetical protein
MKGERENCVDVFDEGWMWHVPAPVCLVQVVEYAVVSGATFVPQISPRICGDQRHGMCCRKKHKRFLMGLAVHSLWRWSRLNAHMYFWITPYYLELRQRQRLSFVSVHQPPGRWNGLRLAADAAFPDGVLAVACPRPRAPTSPAPQPRHRCVFLSLLRSFLT